MEILKRKNLLILLFCLPLVLSGQQYLTYYHDNVYRDYILYLPDNLPEDAPLVFMFHGYSGSAHGMMNYCGMNQIANENKFAVCYPQGTSDDWNNHFWHVGYDFHLNETVDDVGFVVELANYLQSNYNLSSQFAFCSGMSNGGDMSYLMACQASETFMAAAPVAGCMMKWIYDSCEPENVMPIFATNGTNDNTTWWNGDINNVAGWGAYMSVMDAIEFWTDLNNTSDYIVEYLPDLDPDDGSYIKAEMYTKGDNNQEVWLYKIVDGGHDWPGSWGNMDVNSSEEIWDFFELVIQNSAQGINDNQPNSIFKVHQNYPNPFSYVTTISYELYKKSKVIVSIYNVFGEEVAQFVNAIQQPGVKTVSWTIPNDNRAGINAGVYFCIVQAENSRQVKQMILLKE